MKLVIIESVSKKKTLSKILASLYGTGVFKVTASLGHIRDLPPKELGVDVQDGFRPHYVTAKNKAKVIKSLSSYVAEADEVYIAVDPDREGESIAWHILQVTKPKVKVHRVTFNEITRAGVQKAFDNPHHINMDLVAAQEARRILDRLVGYKVSPALWRGLDESKLSAGRVQSVALKSVVERQREIDKFVAREYWSIQATFSVPRGEFVAKCVGWQGKQCTRETFQSKEDTQLAISQLSNTLFRIAKLVIKTRSRKPFAPFITSTLQQAASTHLKLSPEKTMSVAQTLYEAGYITYMRTDSPAVSQEAADLAEDTIRSQYGDLYLPEGRRKFKAKAGSQEAHECIRPTDIDLDALSDLDVYSTNLYQLIWQRFMASQMADAIYDRTTIYVKGGHALFMAQHEVLQFDGFLQVYDYGEDINSHDSHDENLPEVKPLPAVAEQQTCKASLFTPNQHVTRPPATFSEASLVKQLETLGVGRPSTYSMMVSTIRQRKYVEIRKRRVIPTSLGIRVISFLDEHFALIFNYDFTRLMESSLDKIAAGELDTRQFLSAFWDKFSPLVEPWQYATPDRSRAKRQQTGESCPVCKKGQLELRSGKKGRFLGCSRYPHCKYSRDVKTAAPVLIGRECPKCGSQLCVRSKRNSEEKFIGCTNYPECKHSEALQSNPA